MGKLYRWCHSNSVSFKSHSISVTFKFCAVRIALSALEPGNMLVVTPGKITLAYYHLAIKHPVRNHLLKVTPSKKSATIMNIFIKNGWMLLHQMAYNGPDHVQITKVYWRLTVSWKKFFNKSSKMFYSKVNWKHFCWILFQFTFYTKDFGYLHMIITDTEIS